MTDTNDPRLKQLSQRLDDSLEALHQRLNTLYDAKQNASGAAREALEEQIRDLKNQEIRLLKSKKAAWMAHWLRTENEVEIVEHPHRKLGIALISVSLIALILLGIYAYSLNS